MSYVGEISVPKDSSLTDQLVCYINTPRCTKYTQVWYTVLPLVSVSYVGEISVLGHFIEKSLMTCNPDPLDLSPGLVIVLVVFRKCILYTGSH